jgi:hypothetical protein
MTSLHQAFKNAKLKVERGDRHIREYTQTIIAFLQTDFCKVTVEEDGETGNYLVKVDATAPYPPALPTIIGDAAHNLRTAIDYIIVEFTGLDPDWISLPVGKERGEVQASPKYQAIWRKLPQFADFLLDEIQPYAGGKFKIWELAKLDNIDKHKLLIPITKVSTLLRLDIEDDRGNRIGDTFTPVEEGTVLEIPSSGTGKIKVNHKGQAGIDICFGHETPFPGAPVIAVLADLSEFVLQAIEALEVFCFGKITNPHAGKI